MTFVEADLVPLSALQHYLFCPRQCALIPLGFIPGGLPRSEDGRDS